MGAGNRPVNRIQRCKCFNCLGLYEVERQQQRSGLPGEWLLYHDHRGFSAGSDLLVRSEERRGGEVSGVQTCALPISTVSAYMKLNANNSVPGCPANGSYTTTTVGSVPEVSCSLDRKSVVEGK